MGAHTSQPESGTEPDSGQTLVHVAYMTMYDVRRQHRVKLPPIANLRTFRLPDVPFKIAHLSFGRLTLGVGRDDDIWQFLVNNRANCPRSISFAEKVQD